MYAYRKWAVVGLVAVLTVTMQATAAAVPPDTDQGQLTVLGDLGGGSYSYAAAMNDRGDIVGISLSADAGYVPALWRYDHNMPIALGVEAGTATAINNRGVVVGDVAGTNDLFLWRNGRVSYLRNRGPDEAIFASDINDREQIVGSTYDSDSGGGAFVWQRGVFTTLPTPQGKRSGTVAINNRGQILGWLLDPATYTTRAVIWESSSNPWRRRSWRLIDLGTLGGPNAIPVDINEKGQAIGSSDVPGAPWAHPFLWENGRMTDLLGASSTGLATARAINDAGLVVGQRQVSMEPRFSPLVWNNGQMIDIGMPGYSGEAAAVNNRGQVAGLTHLVRGDQLVDPVLFRWESGGTRLYAMPYPAPNLAVVGVDNRGRIVASIITDEEAILLRGIG